MTSPRDTDQGPSKSEIRTVVASSIVGTTVEWYDFFLYGIAAGLVFDKLFFPSSDPIVGTLLAFATFAIGFMARPFGGLIFGHIGDRIGRKKTLVATMMIMGVATCLIGLVPTYATIGIAAPILLVVLRLAQGVAIGGEWGGAVLMAVEYAPRGKRGFYGSLPQIGLAIGLMLGTGVFAALNSTLSEAAFLDWVGGSLHAQRDPGGGRPVHPPQGHGDPGLPQARDGGGEGHRACLELIKSPQSRRNMVLGMGSRWAEGVAFNTWAVFAIAYGTGTLHLSRQTLLLAVMAAAATMIVFIPVFGKSPTGMTADTCSRRAA